MKWTSVAILSLLAFGPAARADSGQVGTVLKVSGTLVTQSTALDSSPLESFVESYEIDMTQFATNTGGKAIGTLVPGSMAFSSTGPLGAFTLTSFSPYFVNWTDANGDVIQITFYEDPGGAICAAATDCGGLFWYSATGEFSGGVTVTEVPLSAPEPPLLYLLVTSIVTLACLRLLRRV